MNLAARLDRLRGAAPPVADVAPAARASPAADIDRLSMALQGRALPDGLVVSDSVESVVPDDHTPGLDELPEALGRVSGDWVYLDTETTGLSGGTGNLAFMVGVARLMPGGGLSVRQYTLGGFRAERRMLADLTAWVGDGATLVSYNGRCFDVPLLQARLRLHRLPDGLARLPHVDLVYTVRRAYRDLWPDCRLQTAERERLEFERTNDLPGSAAPMAWRRWLSEGEPGLLTGVLRHNRQDLVSLAWLHRALVDDHAAAGGRAMDRWRIGRAWEAVGEPRRAMAVWSTAPSSSDERALLALAAAHRRAGAWAQAEAVWMTLYDQGSAAAALALSKYHEHRRRDFARAMGFADACGPVERATRHHRLRRKLRERGDGLNLELPLDGSGRA
jgi:hypothetical protein